MRNVALRVGQALKTGDYQWEIKVYSVWCSKHLKVNPVNKTIFCHKVALDMYLMIFLFEGKII